MQWTANWVSHIGQTLRNIVASVPYPSIEFSNKSPLKYFA